MLTIDEIADRAGGVGKLAELLGVHWSTVCGFKRTRRALIPPHHARTIAEALDIPLHEIRPDLWPAPKKTKIHDRVTA
jgi:DNA-binding transcriptional regulator YdaS (Cro superfamily)